VALGNRKGDAVARPTHREKLALVEKLLTQIPTRAQRNVILRRLAEEVAKDALKQQQSQVN
jgi:phytoene/squalene synthetase